MQYKYLGTYFSCGEFVQHEKAQTHNFKVVISIQAWRILPTCQSKKKNIRFLNVID